MLLCFKLEEKRNIMNYSGSTSSDLPEWQDGTIPSLDLSLMLVSLIVAVWYVSSIAIYLNKSGDLSMKTLPKFGKDSLLKMLLLSGIFCILFILLEGMKILSPFLPLDDYDMACDAISDARYFVYCCAQFMIYLYLWLRMKFYYEKYAETNERSRCFVILTWACFGFLVLTFTALYAISTSSTNFIYNWESKKCIFNPKPDGTKHMIFFSLAIILVVTLSQLSILLLIVRVMLKQKNSIKRYGGPSSNSLGQVSSSSLNRLYLALKKLVLYSSLSVVSDVMMTVVGIAAQMHVTENNSSAVIFVVKIVAIFINMFLMTGTFSEPCKVFFTPCTKNSAVANKTNSFSKITASTSC